MAKNNPDPSSDANQDGGTGDPGSTDNQNASGVTDAALETLVQQRVQSRFDQNMSFLEQGRFSEMDPKVIQLLDRYRTLNEPQQTTEPSNPFVTQGRQSNQQANPLEEKGRDALRKEILTEIKGEVTQAVVVEEWAEEVRDFFEEIKESGVKYDPNDPTVQAVIALDNRTLYPANPTGWRNWRKAAKAMRQKYLHGKPTNSEGGDGDLDADRARAQGATRQPQVDGAATASGNLAQNAKDFMAGKITREAYLEKLNAAKSTR